MKLTPTQSGGWGVLQFEISPCGRAQAIAADGGFVAGWKHGKQKHRQARKEEAAQAQKGESDHISQALSAERKKRPKAIHRSAYSRGDNRFVTARVVRGEQKHLALRRSFSLCHSERSEESVLVCATNVDSSGQRAALGVTSPEQQNETDPLPETVNLRPIARPGFR